MATRVSPPRGVSPPRLESAPLASRRTASLRWSSRCNAKASLLEALGLASPTTFVLNRYLKCLLLCLTLPRRRQGPPLRPLSNRPLGPSNAVRPLRLDASSSDRIVPGVSATSPNTSRCRAPFRRPIPSLLAAGASRFPPSQVTASVPRPRSRPCSSRTVKRGFARKLARSVFAARSGWMTHVPLDKCHRLSGVIL